MKERESHRAAEDYCRRYATYPSRRIAKMLCHDFPHIFKSAEDARDAVRYVRGAKGAISRQRNHHIVARIIEELPETHAESWTPVELPAVSRPTPYLIIADVHAPYHDPRALALAIEHGIKAMAKSVIILGDFVDCFAISRHGKSLDRFRTMEREREIARQILSVIARTFNTVYYLLGNHELRLPKYYADRVPEMLHAPSLTFQAAMDADYGEKYLERIGVKVIERECIVYGRLHLLHGHEWGRGLVSPVNPARGAFIRTLECTVTGHLHRSSHHDETTLRGRLVGCWSLGCLCGLHPEYARVNKWNHGFALLTCDKDGWFEVKNHRIVEGRVV